MKKNAIILTNGLFKTSYAKTAHGLVRGSDRFKIIGLIDPDHAGSDAGALLDGIHRNIPVFSDVPDGIKKAASNIEYAIVGVAT